MKIPEWGLAIAAVCALFLLGAAQARTSAMASAGPAGSIAFETLHGLYVISARGGKAMRISGTTGGDGDPVWSPNGKLIAFDREQDSNGVFNDEVSRDVWVMHPDGSSKRQLTSAGGDDGWAQWSPSGRSLVFQSDRDGGAAVYVVSLQTGQARRISDNAWYPQWLPDRRIIFSDTSDRIITVRPYGADRREFPTQPGGVVTVRLSPDQQSIVYTTEAENDIYLADSHGGASVRLVTARKQVANDPTWSPDGQWIAYDFAPNQQVNGDIYLTGKDGTGTTRLTHFGTACCPDWR